MCSEKPNPNTSDSIALNTLQRYVITSTPPYLYQSWVTFSSAYCVFGFGLIMEGFYSPRQTITFWNAAWFCCILDLRHKQKFILSEFFNRIFTFYFHHQIVIGMVSCLITHFHLSLSLSQISTLIFHPFNKNVDDTTRKCPEGGAFFVILAYFNIAKTPAPVTLFLNPVNFPMFILVLYKKLHPFAKLYYVFSENLFH